MKKYIESVQQRDPHERRVFAMRVAGVVTGMLFFVWLTTLGLRFGSAGEAVQEGDSSQTAAAAQATYMGDSGLEVAPNSIFGQ